MMKTRGARYFSNYSAGCRRTAWAGFLGFIYYSTSSTRTKRNRDFHAIRAISFDGLPAFNLIRTPHPQRSAQLRHVCMMWFSNALFACAENPARALPHCWLVKNVAASSIFRRFDARGLRGESRVSNSLRAAVKSSECWSRTHSHNFITSQHTKSHYLATGEGGRTFFLNSPAASSLFNRILNSNGVENFIMAVPPAVVPAHPCARSLHLHNHLNRALAPPFKTAAPASLSLSAVCAAEISLESKRAHKAPFYLHTLRFPIQSVFSTFLLSPNAHTHRVQKKNCALNKKRICFSSIFSTAGLRI